MSQLTKHFIKKFVDEALNEDGFYENFHYINSLPNDIVSCQLKVKSDLVMAGLPFFFEVFNLYLDEKIDYEHFLSEEGKVFSASDKKEFHFELPFCVAVTLERIALNILNRMCSIASITKKFVDKTQGSEIKILDTRKTTPGLRAFEKYATRLAGAYNHRMNQVDVFMVKDNHKDFFGGLEEAISFFNEKGCFYNSMVVEIHDIAELKHAMSLGVKHVMLDNFSPNLVKEAISIKKEGMTFEVSGGINLETLESYLIEGVDAISVGMLTYAPDKVDLSLKYQRKA